MKTLIIYDSLFGNTEQIARTIAGTLKNQGPVELLSVEASSQSGIQEKGRINQADLLILGCPTQRRTMTPEMDDLLDKVDPATLRGMQAAVFDTRFNMPRWLSGSAARDVAKVLRKSGCSLISSPRSFFVVKGPGPLEAEEVKRATDWANELVEVLEAKSRVAMGA